MKEIQAFLVKLGLTEEEVRLYCTLLSRGSLTILEASRAANIERTRLYRLAEKLIDQGLVEEVLEHKSRRVKATAPEQIRLIVQREAKRIRDLEQEYSAFADTIQNLAHKPSTQVRYYRGIVGIKQILWKETKAQKSLIGYTYRNLEEVVGVQYFRQWVGEIERNKIVSRDLRTDSFLESSDQPGFVRIHIDQSAWRYLPDKVMHLTHNLDVYNDVVAIYYWEDGDVFGVEIQNQQIADMQRSIFETLWQLAKNYSLPAAYKRFEQKH